MHEKLIRCVCVTLRIRICVCFYTHNVSKYILIYARWNHWRTKSPEPRRSCLKVMINTPFCLKAVKAYRPGLCVLGENWRRPRVAPSGISKISYSTPAVEPTRLQTDTTFTKHFYTDIRVYTQSNPPWLMVSGFSLKIYKPARRRSPCLWRCSRWGDFPPIRGLSASQYSVSNVKHTNISCTSH